MLNARTWASSTCCALAQVAPVCQQHGCPISGLMCSAPWPANRQPPVALPHTHCKHHAWRIPHHGCSRHPRPTTQHPSCRQRQVLGKPCNLPCQRQLLAPQPHSSSAMVSLPWPRPALCQTAAYAWPLQTTGGLRIMVRPCSGSGLLQPPCRSQLQSQPLWQHMVRSLVPSVTGRAQGRRHWSAVVSRTLQSTSGSVSGTRSLQNQYWL
mmetsp:Transcript_23081/g.50651  ORF Transcript_23081/g.50651 Transcript_23081/m.50651 type:complete len:209 (-) Transcript_23081:3377-4003(-)